MLIIVLVEKLLPFKSLFLLVNARFRRCHRDQGFDLPAIYSEILPVSVTRDHSRQTSDHPALAMGAVASSSLTKET